MKKSYNSLFLFILMLTSCFKNKQQPQLAKNYLEQSIIEIQQKNLKKGLQLVNQSIEISPTPQAIYLKATILYQLKEFQESLILFKKVIDNNKSSINLRSDALNNYACNLLALGQKDEAQKLWLQLTTDKNYLSSEVAWFNLGLFELSASLKKENLINAKRYFIKTIEIAPDYIDALYYLSVTLFYLEDYNSAKKILTKLINQFPEHEQAKNLLDKILQ